MHNQVRAIQEGKNWACTMQAGRGLVSLLCVCLHFPLVSSVKCLFSKAHVEYSLQRVDRLITSDEELEHLKSMKGKDTFLSHGLAHF